MPVFFALDFLLFLLLAACRLASSVTDNPPNAPPGCVGTDGLRRMGEGLGGEANVWLGVAMPSAVVESATEGGASLEFVERRLTTRRSSFDGVCIGFFTPGARSLRSASAVACGGRILHADSLAVLV